MVKSVAKKKITLHVNGDAYRLEVPVNRTLLSVLRDDVGLQGTKEGCGSGDCGACTVLLDGKPVNSCLVLAVTADGRQITTVEGLAKDDKLHPLQEAFIQEGAVQCGFCTPGMLLTAKGLLDENPMPSESEIRKALAGNLCRCTGYVRIVKAVQKAAANMAQSPRLETGPAETRGGFHGDCGRKPGDPGGRIGKSTRRRGLWGRRAPGGHAARGRAAQPLRPCPHLVDRCLGGAQDCTASAPWPPAPTCPTCWPAKGIKDMPFLAVDRVRYVGEPVAAVAADDRGDGAQGRQAHQGGVRGAAGGAGRGWRPWSRMRPSCTRA